MNPSKCHYFKLDVLFDPLLYSFEWYRQLLLWICQFQGGRQYVDWWLISVISQHTYRGCIYIVWFSYFAKRWYYCQLSAQAWRSLQSIHRYIKANPANLVILVFRVHHFSKWSFVLSFTHNAWSRYWRYQSRTIEKNDWSEYSDNIISCMYSNLQYCDRCFLNSAGSSVEIKRNYL